MLSVIISISIIIKQIPLYLLYSLSEKARENSHSPPHTKGNAPSIQTRCRSSTTLHSNSLPQWQSPNLPTRTMCPTQQNCLGMACGMKHKAQGVHLISKFRSGSDQAHIRCAGPAPINRGCTSQPTELRRFTCSALSDKTGHPQRSHVHTSMGPIEALTVPKPGCVCRQAAGGTTPDQTISFVIYFGSPLLFLESTGEKTGSDVEYLPVSFQLVAQQFVGDESCVVLQSRAGLL